MAEVEVRDIKKSFGGGGAAAVDGISLKCSDGEYLVLLGPSGCGKTTLLRLIAGLERPDDGAISFDGAVVAGSERFVDPEDRHLGMVFQSYALWPTMTVAQNVGFGLRVRGLARRERNAAIARALSIVKLDGLDARRPSQLSGGQKQRVALARCLALEPRLILLDEPLANLDPHLRTSVLDELRRIHREIGATFVLVTHDQDEAMQVADRIVVMNAGGIEQVGTPEALYAMPKTRMVAEFIGESSVVPVEVRNDGDGAALCFKLAGQKFPAAAPAPGSYLACFRPGDLVLASAAVAGAVEASVTGCSYRGDFYALRCRVDGEEAVELELHSFSRAELNQRVLVRIGKSWLLPAGPGT
jgi:iron(III) transport system ATP-binding protein